MTCMTTLPSLARRLVAALIQVGGLGVTSVGVGLILAAGKRVSIKGRLLVKEALNVDSFKGMVRLVKAVLLVTLCFEGTGVVLSFLVFIQDYPLAGPCGPACSTPSPRSTTPALTFWAALGT